MRYEDLKQCPRGTYSLAGQSDCTVCPAGYYCQRPDQNMVECQLGSYSYEGQTSCTVCPMGFRCLDKKGKYIVRCLGGQYLNSTTGRCTDCPAGYSCPNPQGGMDNYIACVPGTYSAIGQSHCTICSPGNYCPQTNVATETPCPAGQLSFGGATSCIPCPMNHECPTTSTFEHCPIYFYSAAGSGVCLPCPNGMDCSDITAVNPQSCPSGYYIQTLDWKCQPCPYGHMCPANSINPVQCPKHQYQDTMASQTCKTCPSGYFSDVGYEYCMPIPAGFQRNVFTTMTQTLQACMEGTYSDWGFASCQTCPDGLLCPAGAEIGTHYGCPKGSYCIGGVQTLCDPGSYGLIERARTKAEGCEKCPAGYYCLAGTENFKLHPCPRGSYCVWATAVPVYCPKGTYNDDLFGKSIADCKLCPMGRQCDTGTTDQGTICPQGYFCPLGTYPGQWPCPPGTFGGYRTGLKDQSECMVCPAGYYCPSGTATPIAVLAGYYQPHQGIGDLAAQVICPPGFYCPNTAMVAFKGFHCYPGYYCPAGSTTNKQQPCPAGTYSDSYEIFDASQCFPCPAGFKCASASTSLTGMTACPKNQYCPQGTASTTTINCIAGTYAPYTNSRSLDDCLQCPYGSYCLAGMDPQTCPIGYYCPKSTQYSQQYPCPAGYYMDYTGAKVLGECKTCMVGNYCPSGSSAPIQCPSGTYNNYTNTLGTTCSNCMPGFYCVYGLPYMCAIGKYSDSGASTCTYCEVGTYCPNQGTAIYDKINQICPAGVFCQRTLTAFQDTDIITGITTTVSGTFGLASYPNLRDNYCPQGYYCPAGTTQTMACPVGTYNRLQGRKSLLDCQKTDGGYYTNVVASTAPTGPCAVGYYCPDGSSSATQVPCPTGTFRGIVGGSLPTDCTICTSGSYCPNLGMSVPLVCPQGFYCPLGTKAPEPCPLGTYGATTGLQDSPSCTYCPAGYYCGQKNLTAPQAQCDDGYYCIQGSVRPEPTDLVTGSICPTGGYCPQGATSPSSCPNGQFNSFTGGQSASDCQTCWPGSYCNGLSILVPCPQGYYCPIGTSTPTSIAAAGYFSPLGSDQQYQCPRGTYNGLTQQPSCNNCDAGYICGSALMTAEANCPAGYYCPSYQTFVSNGNYYTQIPCPQGTYNPNTNQRSVSGCLPCPANQYCSGQALTAPTGSCIAGYFCNQGAIVPNPMVLDSNNYFGPCAAGYYCLANQTPTPCPIGTYSASTNAISSATCLTCTEGMYCGTTGLSAPTDYCAAGYYCPAGSSSQYGQSPSSTTNNTCPINAYCPIGSSSPKICPTGYYNEATTQGACLICPTGYYCVYGVRTVCPVGFICS